MLGNMSTTQVAGDTKRVVRSPDMPRKPTAPKKGDKLTKVTLMLPTEYVEAIDREADQMSEGDEWGRKATRTDVFRVMIKNWLAAK